MKSIPSLQQAVVQAATEFSTAREKLLKAEAAYNQALQENSDTFNVIDKNKQYNFSSNDVVTDC